MDRIQGFDDPYKLSHKSSLFIEKEGDYMTINFLITGNKLRLFFNMRFNGIYFKDQEYNKEKVLNIKTEQNKNLG